MAILKIARMGHSVLVDPAAPIPDPTAERVQRLIGHMADQALHALCCRVRDRRGRIDQHRVAHTGDFENGHG